MEEDNLHVTEDRIQSFVRGIVGELFFPDNRPRQDQPFGATEDDHEINNRFCLKRTIVLITTIPFMPTRHRR
jgi:hypothetical protein